MASNQKTATYLRYFHLAMVVLWVGLSVPGIIYWRDSVFFLIIISLSTQIETSFGAYMAARAEKAGENNEEKD